MDAELLRIFCDWLARKLFPLGLIASTVLLIYVGVPLAVHAYYAEETELSQGLLRVGQQTMHNMTVQLHRYETQKPRSSGLRR